MPKNRKEAGTIPTVLVAPRDPTDAYNESYDADDFDNTGYYENGVYYISDSVPATSNVVTAEEGTEMDPRLAYFDSILYRFETLRAQLQRTPPPEAVAGLGTTHPIFPPPITRYRHSVALWWRGQMESINPAPAQIASMDKRTILRALGSLNGGRLLRSGEYIKPSVSLWIWALLARLPDRGDLSSEEIGVVRELGKRAVLVAIGLGEKNEWQEGMHEVEAGLDEENEGEEDEGTYAANVDEIRLDIDEYSELNIGYSNDTAPPAVNTAPQIGPQLPVYLDNAQADETASKEQDDREPLAAGKDQATPIAAVEEHLPSYKPQLESEEAQFNAAKARMLASLEDEPVEFEVNIEPEIEDPQDTAQDIPPSKSNTRLTVDMILTVAGEMYGQRDLLEFRPAWEV